MIENVNNFTLKYLPSFFTKKDSFFDKKFMYLFCNKNERLFYFKDMILFIK